MKTLLALEELIRSYNGITALDNFKAMESLRVLKELDLKYEGFGEDIEVSSKRMIEEYFQKDNDNSVKPVFKRYLSFAPIGYSVIRQGSNCLVELFSSENRFIISDKQICLLYEMVSDIFEYGELNESNVWCAKDSGLQIELHNVSNATDCIISIIYDENLCQIVNDKNNFIENIFPSTELVLEINTIYLVKVLKRILLNYRSQEMVNVSMPESKRINYSEALKHTLSSARYFNVFTVLSNNCVI